MKIRPFRIAAALILLTIAGVTISRHPFGRYDLLPARAGAQGAAPGIPLDPTSPWPKFRADALQSGRSTIRPAGTADGAAAVTAAGAGAAAGAMSGAPLRPWTFPTGKGIFSSPVVDGAGTVYVGSADGFFYAIRRDGSLNWKFETGGVIDSSALLDDRGRVYFGAGDGRFYCLERESGKELWSFAAHDAAAMKKEYGIELHNVSWFEGNAGMLPDGSILAPNDNHLVYVLDRDTGKQKGQFIGNEMVWSLPALDTRSGRLFFGTDFIALQNLYAYDYHDGKRLWTAGGLGSIAASPLLTSPSRRAGVLLGGFDGYLRAYAADSGKQLWKFAARDHIYASPAQLSDGTVIQPAADGTVYAIDPKNGREKWAYDTLQPIRSSPAVDGDDRIYVGTGDGRLVCLESDGRLRWSWRCIDGPRDDLNASPALAPGGIVVAGETGGIFFVPWDWPLSAEGRGDPRSSLAGAELPATDGAHLLRTEAFGALAGQKTIEVDANEPLCFSLIARKGGQTLQAALDKGLKAEFSNDAAFRLDLAANGSFFTLVPEGEWAGPAGGDIKLRVSGTWKTGMARFGLKALLGHRGGAIDESFDIVVRPRPTATGTVTAGAAATTTGTVTAGASPVLRSAGSWEVPAHPGEAETVFGMSRLAAPNPSMLPSWNQIGFDSLHYLGGVVASLPDEDGRQRALLWVVAGKKDGDAVRPDPEQSLRFPLVAEYDKGLVTLHDYRGFAINFVGSWDMPFGSWRVSAAGPALPGLGANAPDAPVQAAFEAVALCDSIAFYGPFLKIMGLSDFSTGRMTAFGGMNLGARVEMASFGAADVGAVTFAAGSDFATATFTGARLAKGAHVYSLLLRDAASGLPLPLPYTQKTSVDFDAGGRLSALRLDFPKGSAKGRIDVLFLVDEFPAASSTVEVGS